MDLKQQSTMHQDMSAVADIMARHKEDFKRRMIDKLLLIESASIRLTRNDKDLEAMGCIRRECHKLSGVAATLGFPDIGEMAAVIDCAIAKESRSWAELAGQVSGLLDAMEEALD